MTTNPYPALCRDCKHSKPEVRSEWNLRCQHPRVNAGNSWALSNGGDYYGADCRGERERGGIRGVFAPCGMKGKLWEPK